MTACAPFDISHSIFIVFQRARIIHTLIWLTDAFLLRFSPTVRKWYANSKTQVPLRAMPNRRRVLTLPALESAPTRRRQTAPTPRPMRDAATSPARPEPMDDGRRTPERPPSPTVPVPAHLRQRGQQQQQQPDSSAPGPDDEDVPRVPPPSPVAGPSSGRGGLSLGAHSNELAFLHLMREVVVRRAREEPESAENFNLTLRKLDARIQDVIRERDMAVLRNGCASPPGSPQYSPPYPEEPLGDSGDDYHSD